MTGKFGAGPERVSLAAQNFDDTLGGEIHIDEAGASIGDLAIVGDAVVTPHSGSLWTDLAKRLAVFLWCETR